MTYRPEDFLHDRYYQRYLRGEISDPGRWGAKQTPAPPATPPEIAPVLHPRVYDQHPGIPELEIKKQGIAYRKYQRGLPKSAGFLPPAGRLEWLITEQERWRPSSWLPEGRVAGGWHKTPALPSGWVDVPYLSPIATEVRQTMWRWGPKEGPRYYGKVPGVGYVGAKIWHEAAPDWFMGRGGKISWDIHPELAKWEEAWNLERIPHGWRDIGGGDIFMPTAGRAGHYFQDYPPGKYPDLAGSTRLGGKRLGYREITALWRKVGEPKVGIPFWPRAEAMVGIGKTGPFDPAAWVENLPSEKFPGMSEWSHKATRDPLDSYIGAEASKYPRWAQKGADKWLTTFQDLPTLSAKKAYLKSLRKMAGFEAGAAKALGVAGTAMFAYGLFTTAFDRAEAAPAARGRVGSWPEFTATPHRADPLTRYRMYHPEPEGARRIRETAKYLSWLGGPPGIAMMGTAFTAADVAIAASQGEDMGTIGALAREGIVSTARDVSMMMALGWGFGKLGQGWGILKSKWAQRVARKAAYSGEGRTLTWMADRGAAAAKRAGEAAGKVSKEIADLAFDANKPLPPGWWERMIKVEAIAAERTGGIEAGRAAAKIGYTTTEHAATTVAKRAGAFSKFWQWMGEPLYGPKTWWNPLATRGKALIAAQTVSKVMASPWLDPRNAAFTWQAFTLSAGEMQRQGISPTKAALRREESGRWFAGSAVTGLKSLLLTGGWRDLNYVQTDPGETLANYGPGAAINLEMALAFHGKKVERADIKGAIGRAGPSPYNYGGGDIAGGAMGVARPILEYALTVNAVNWAVGRLGGWAAKEGAGRWAQASQAFAFGLMSPQEPSGLALGWTFAGRSKGPQRLLLGSLMGLGALATGNAETGKTFGRGAYMGLWGIGTGLSMLGASGVSPGYKWASKGTEASMLRAIMLNELARTPYEKLGWWERMMLNRQRQGTKDQGGIADFMAQHFSLLVSGQKYVSQVWAGGSAYNPFLRGRTVAETWTPTQIESYMWGKEGGQRMMSLDEEVLLSQAYMAASYQADFRTSKALTAQAMSIAPNYVPFVIQPARKEALSAAQHKYYISKGEFGETLYMKQGRYYDKFAPGKGAVGAERDILVGERPMAGMPWVKGEGLTKDQFIKHLSRVQLAEKVEGETPAFKLVAGKIKEETKKPAVGPFYSSLIGFRYESHLKPEETIEDEEDITLLMEKDLYGAGVGGYQRKYAPDPVFLHPDRITGTVPFSDDLLLAALADSVQEWNWRSPRRGGEPVDGGWD